MKARFNQAPLYLTITLLSALTGGCGLSGGENPADLNVQQSPQPVASQQPFPKPTVPAISAPSKIALTRPTNPDDRLRVIKSGRNDPFGLLVQPLDPNAAKPENVSTSGSAKPSSSTSEKVGNRIANSYDQFLKRITDAYTKPGQPGAASSPSAAVDLPPLPKEPELAKVQVTGVVVVAGAPRAIVQAPNEPTSRTVGIGDSLSGGQLYVKNIDMSNRAEPVVFFQQGSMEFAVAVGRDPVLVASAAPAAARPVRGLYSVQVP